MSEDKPSKPTIKEQLEQKRKSMGLEKEESVSVDTPKKDKPKEWTPKTQETIENAEDNILANIKTKDLFNELIERARDKRAKIIIKKAHNEYKDLKKRIGEVDARRAVGQLLSKHVESSLLAAQGVSNVGQDQARMKRR